MKLPSLSGMMDKAVSTIKRFPLPLISSILAAYTAISLIEMKPQGDTVSWPYVKFCLLCLLSLPAFVSFEMLADASGRRVWRWGGPLLCIAYLLWMYISWTDNDLATGWALFFLSAIAFHLLVSFAPFIRNNDMSRFWEYNKNVFLRLLTSALYSGVLFLGLALAILAIDQLFEANVKEERYFELLMLIGMVFNTWFFLSGFPVHPDEAEVVDYPKGLRVFTQFVLLPLVTIYLLILYVYSGKILITAHWPSGWVCYLVIGFSTAGILALLLIWPLREDEHHRWIKLYARGFFFALFPLVVLLFFSIYMRIAQYGITMNRYFVILLALWLSYVAAYFLISKVKRVKMIPLSLFVAAIISAVNPVGSVAVSLRSQRARLIEIAEKFGFYEDGKFTRLSQQTMMPLSDQKQFYEIAEYITDTYPVADYKDMFSSNVDSAYAKNGRYGTIKLIASSIGLDDQAGTYQGDIDRFSFSSTNYNSAIDVSGYDYCVSWDFYSGKRDDDEKIELSDSLSVVLNFNGDELKFKTTEGELLGSVKISDLEKKLKNENHKVNEQIEPEKLNLVCENDRLKARVCLKYVYGRRLDSESLITESINSVILIKMK